MKRSRLIPLLFIAFLFVACTLTSNTLSIAPTPTFEVGKLGTVDKDIVYCSIDGVDLKLDIYYPKTNTGPWPVLFHVHGGGWSSGSKDNSFLFPDFTELGVLGIEVGYRLAPGAQFPAQIEDIKCAVRFLRSHAAEYHLDPDRIMAIGESAGGHLVSLLGVTGSSGEFADAGQWREFSANVNSVISISGPANLDSIVCWNDYTAQLSALVFGAGDQCNTNDPKLVSASPSTYVSADDPPILLISGTADPVVPYDQAVTFYDQMIEAGVDARLLLIEGGDHGLQVPGNPAATDEAWQAMIDFIVEQLNVVHPPG